MEENKNCESSCNCDHEHDNTSGCGCGCDHDEMEESIIYVTFEDEDEEVPCSVLSIFECEGREYIALAPKDQVEGEDEAEVLFYRFSEDGDDVQLDDIETDEEWDKVASVFDEDFFGPLDEE